MLITGWAELAKPYFFGDFVGFHFSTQLTMKQFYSYINGIVIEPARLVSNSRPPHVK